LFTIGLRSEIVTKSSLRCDHILHVLLHYLIKYLASFDRFIYA